MNYIGSKLKLSGFIIKSMKDTVGNLDDKIFAELFAGTGIVSRKLKNEVAKIIVNDIEPYSYILNRNYIGNTKRLNYEKHLNQLNALEGIAGFIYSHYCHGGGKGRKYFSDENGKKKSRAGGCHPD